MNSVSYKNISVNFTDVGEGKVIVLLHGFLENLTMWKALSTVLSQSFRVITIDLLGHGKTDCLGYVHSMEENAEIVHAVLQSLKIRKAIIAGHSMGGYVALAFAEKYPTMIRAIGLINSTPKADSDERKINRDRAIAAVKQGYANFVKLAVGNLFSANNRIRLQTEIEHVRSEALKTPLQGIVATLEGMKIRKDREFLLANNQFSTLLILGEKDPVLNFEETVEFQKYDRVDVVTFPDGHMSHIENADELAVAFLKFVRKIK